MANLDGTKIAAAVLGGLVVALVSSLITASVIGSDHPGRAEVNATIDRSIKPINDHLHLIEQRLTSIDAKVDKVVVATVAVGG